MPVTREESQRRTRERLVEAAQQTVARCGYGGSSIGAIVEAAGFTKGAFFSNFESKDELLLEVLRRHFRNELAGMAAILEQSSGQEDLGAALDAYVDQIALNTDWMTLGVELALHASRDAGFAVGYLQIRSNFALALGRLATQVFARYGRLPPMQPEGLGNMLLSLVQGIGLSAAAGTAQPAPSVFTCLVLDGLIAAAAPIEDAATNYQAHRPPPLVGGVGGGGAAYAAPRTGPSPSPSHKGRRTTSRQT